MFLFSPHIASRKYIPKHQKEVYIKDVMTPMPVIIITAPTHIHTILCRYTQSHFNFIATQKGTSVSIIHMKQKRG